MTFGTMTIGVIVYNWGTMTHTPGPWRVTEASTAGAPRVVAYHGTPIVSFGNQIRWQNRKRVWDNARLIAAAPEMLAALKRLVLAFDVGDMAHTTINGRGHSALVEARQAIADTEVPK